MFKYCFVAFMCHHNTFLLYTSIQNVTQKKWDVVTHVSLFTSLLVAALFGIAGYATFTAWSQGKKKKNKCMYFDFPYLEYQKLSIKFVHFVWSNRINLLYVYSVIININQIHFLEISWYKKLYIFLYYKNKENKSVQGA